jgi:hypothetical protein
MVTNKIKKRSDVAENETKIFLLVIKRVCLSIRVGLNRANSKETEIIDMSAKNFV